MLTTHWLEEAVVDLHALRHYIGQENPRAAKKIASQLLEAVELLSAQPNLGRPGRILHTRELIVSNTPYIIPYRVVNGTIEILRVLHAAMQWPEAL